MRFPEGPLSFSPAEDELGRVMHDKTRLLHRRSFQRGLHMAREHGALVHAVVIEEPIERLQLGIRFEHLRETYRWLLDERLGNHPEPSLQPHVSNL